MVTMLIEKVSWLGRLESNIGFWLSGHMRAHAADTDRYQLAETKYRVDTSYVNYFPANQSIRILRGTNVIISLVNHGHE